MEPVTFDPSSSIPVPSPRGSNISFPDGDSPSFGIRQNYRRPISAGSVGVRGLIADVHGASCDERVALINNAVRELRRGGVRRAHIFVTQSSDLEASALRAGFALCPGEHLHQRTLMERPQAQIGSLRDHLVRDGTEEDLIRIGLTLRDVPELAFQSWEFPLIRAGLQNPNRYFRIIEHQGNIVGVSIGGAFEERGTVSHMWVADDHRNHGLGHILSDISLGALYDAGARNVYLMTVAGNERAYRFWHRQGFRCNPSEIFLERDFE